MRKASLLGAILLMGTLGLSVSAAAKDDHHEWDKNHHEAREMHEREHHDHMSEKERRAAWEKHERERRDHERAEWAKHHPHHDHPTHPHPPQSAALRKPVPPAGENHYHQYHRPEQTHVAPPAQGK